MFCIVHPDMRLLGSYGTILFLQILLISVHQRKSAVKKVLVVALLRCVLCGKNSFFLLNQPDVIKITPCSKACSVRHLSVRYSHFPQLVSKNQTRPALQNSENSMLPPYRSLPRFILTETLIGWGLVLARFGSRFPRIMRSYESILRQMPFKPGSRLAKSPVMASASASSMSGS